MVYEIPASFLLFLEGRIGSTNSGLYRDNIESKPKRFHPVKYRIDRITAKQSQKEEKEAAEKSKCPVAV